MILTVALLLWFCTGLVVALFFLDPLRERARRFNDRYAGEYAHHFGRHHVARMRRILVISEISSFVIGTALFLNVIFGLWAAAAMFFVIIYFVRLLHHREVELFDDQMIDIAYAMKNSLKAGMTLQQAMHLIATEFRPPASEQFAIAVREAQIGASVEDALRHIEQRMPNQDFRVIVTAVEILRQTGGNMVETFELLVETLKSRKRVEGKIKALTAQGRMSAIILCSMPFVMALMLYFMNRPYIQPLFTTVLGNIILTIVLLLVATGWLLIKKVITIEV
jgi:tight adherence protein B